ncbi:MAG: RnfABCDGE type electron transport complex subunit D [Thermoplasmata archaeon]|nr:RnfABCDGE type electron transport complex subunit D [Thermoplasmata archaeon]
MEAIGAAPPPASTPVPRPIVVTVRRWLPARRLLWVVLAVLGVVGVQFLGGGLGIESLVVLPLVAVSTDLLFQQVRHPRPRFPDAALATGLFLALLFPPAVPLAAAGAVTFAAIGLRHVLRARGRPWFNPAAAGLVLGAVAFGLAPAWWGAANEVAVIAAGAAVFVWNLPRWRVPVAFFSVFTGLAILGRLLAAVGTGSSGALSLTTLAVADPTVLFFGLLLLPDPRSAPADPRLGFLYGAAIATAASVIPLGVPTLALPLALLVGNAMAVAIRLRRVLRREWALEEAGRWRAPASGPRALGPSRRWSPLRRMTGGVGVVLVFLLSVATVPVPAYGPPAIANHSGSAHGSAVVAVALCQHDNPVINKATLHHLHHVLGPSVVLVYQRTTGILVYYDPVHHQTVKETDLYQDLGYAEFATHDVRVAGCVA